MGYEDRRPQELFYTHDVWLMSKQRGGNYLQTFYSLPLKDITDIPQLIRLAREHKLIVEFQFCGSNSQGLATFHKTHESARMFSDQCLIHGLGYDKDHSTCIRGCAGITCNETLDEEHSNSVVSAPPTTIEQIRG